MWRSEQGPSGEGSGDSEGNVEEAREVSARSAALQGERSERERRVIEACATKRGERRHEFVLGDQSLSSLRSRCACSSDWLSGHLLGVSRIVRTFLYDEVDGASSLFCISYRNQWTCTDATCTYRYEASGQTLDSSFTIKPSDLHLLLLHGVQPEVGALLCAHLWNNPYLYSKCPVCRQGRMRRCAAEVNCSSLVLVEFLRDGNGEDLWLPAFPLFVAPLVELEGQQYEASAVIYNNGYHWWADMVCSPGLGAGGGRTGYHYDGLTNKGVLNATGSGLTQTSDATQISMVLYRRSAGDAAPATETAAAVAAAAEAAAAQAAAAARRTTAAAPASTAAEGCAAAPVTAHTAAPMETAAAATAAQAYAAAPVATPTAATVEAAEAAAAAKAAAAAEAAAVAEAASKEAAAAEAASKEMAAVEAAAAAEAAAGGPRLHTHHPRAPVPYKLLCHTPPLSRSQGVTLISKAASNLQVTQMVHLVMIRPWGPSSLMHVEGES